LSAVIAISSGIGKIIERMFRFTARADVAGRKVVNLPCRTNLLSSTKCDAAMVGGE
jgi:hypothetical protein